MALGNFFRTIAQIAPSVALGTSPLGVGLAMMNAVRGFEDERAQRKANEKQRRAMGRANLINVLAPGSGARPAAVTPQRSGLSTALGAIGQGAQTAMALQNFRTQQQTQKLQMQAAEGALADQQFARDARLGALTAESLPLNAAQKPTVAIPGRQLSSPPLRSDTPAPLGGIQGAQVAGQATAQASSRLEGALEALNPTARMSALAAFGQRQGAAAEAAAKQRMEEIDLLFKQNAAQLDRQKFLLDYEKFTSSLKGDPTADQLKQVELLGDVVDRVLKAPGKVFDNLGQAETKYSQIAGIFKKAMDEKRFLNPQEQNVVITMLATGFIEPGLAFRQDDRTALQENTRGYIEKFQDFFIKAEDGLVINPRNQAEVFGVVETMFKEQSGVAKRIINRMLTSAPGYKMLNEAGRNSALSYIAPEWLLAGTTPFGTQFGDLSKKYSESVANNLESGGPSVEDHMRVWQNLNNVIGE